MAGSGRRAAYKTPNFERDGRRFQALDTRFHIGTARATGNGTLLRLGKQLTGTLWAARRLLPGYGLDDPAFTLDIHARTLAAILSRDPEAVAQVMDEHLAHLEHAWQRDTTRTALRPSPMENGARS